MKIAIVFSGYARTIHHCLPSFVSKVASSNHDFEIRVFCCLWESSLGRVDKLNDPWHYKVQDLNRLELESGNELKEFIERNCNVQAHVKLIDPLHSQNVMSEGRNLGMQYPELLSQYYMIHESFEMVKEYSPEYYVRARPDMMIESFPNLSKNSEIILSEYVWYQHRAEDGHENEMIWISNKEFAKKTFSIIDEIREGKLLVDPQHGEALTGKYFSKIYAKKERFNFNYRIAR